MPSPKKARNSIEYNNLWFRPSIHPTYARLLIAQLRQQGFDDTSIFAGTHLQWTQLLGENRFLSLEQLRRPDTACCRNQRSALAGPAGGQSYPGICPRRAGIRDGGG